MAPLVEHPAIRRQKRGTSDVSAAAYHMLILETVYFVMSLMGSSRYESYGVGGGYHEDSSCDHYH